jgi:hypothetical protein
MLTTLSPSCTVVVKYGNLNFLEPSGPLQASNGTALPLPAFIRCETELILCFCYSMNQPIIHTVSLFQMKHTALLLVIMTSCCVSLISSSKILALFPYIGKSHFDVLEPFVKELAARGHQVVVLSHFPQKYPVAN